MSSGRLLVFITNCTLHIIKSDKTKRITTPKWLVGNFALNENHSFKPNETWLQNVQRCEVHESDLLLGQNCFLIILLLKESFISAAVSAQGDASFCDTSVREKYTVVDCASGKNSINLEEWLNQFYAVFTQVWCHKK